MTAFAPWKMPAQLWSTSRSPLTGKIITSREPIDLLRFLGPVGKPWLKRVDYLAHIRTPRLPPHDQNLEAANVGTLRKKDVFVSRIKDLPPPTEAEEYRNTAEILHDLVAQVRFDNMRDALFGHPEERRPSSVPPVGAPPRPNYAPPPPSSPPPPPSYGPQGGGMPQGYQPPSGGPSFLGTAAAAAAGTIGGSLLLGGIRNMLGGGGHGAFTGTP